MFEMLNVLSSDLISIVQSDCAALEKRAGLLFAKIRCLFKSAGGASIDIRH